MNVGIIIAILIFTLVVVIHELGHFLLAKKNGVGVPEFSIGMGPRIITIAKTKQGFTVKFFASQKYFEEREDWKDITKYSWKLFPIGGSCAMLGEDEELEDDRAFNKKGVWARISVVAAGPIFNFILAFVLSMIIVAIAGYNPAKVYSVVEGQPGYTAGIKEGDIITSINGKKIEIGREIDTYLQFYPLTGEDIEIGLLRDKKEMTVTLNPNYSTYLLGFGYDPSTAGVKVKVNSLNEGMPLQAAGVQVGDKIVRMNGTEIADGPALKKYMETNPLSEEAITLVYEHDGVQKEITVTPKFYEGKTLGIGASYYREKANPWQVVKYSGIEVKYWIELTLGSLKQMVMGKVSTDDISGPVGIVSMIGNSYEDSISSGWDIVILNMLNISLFLSANLGVMNLLPFPALDGGRLVFLFLEVIRRKPVPQEKEGLVHMAGLVALMLLMVFVMFNDIQRLIR